jgi:hypothetical protein
MCPADVVRYDPDVHSGTGIVAVLYHGLFTLMIVFRRSTGLARHPTIKQPV